MTESGLCAGGKLTICSVLAAMMLLGMSAASTSVVADAVVDVHTDKSTYLQGQTPLTYESWSGVYLKSTELGPNIWVYRDGVLWHTHRSTSGGHSSDWGSAPALGSHSFKMAYGTSWNVGLGGYEIAWAEWDFEVVVADVHTDKSTYLQGQIPLTYESWSGVYLKSTELGPNIWVYRDGVLWHTHRSTSGGHSSDWGSVPPALGPHSFKMAYATSWNTGLGGYNIAWVEWSFQVTQAPDTDGDGCPDYWEIAWSFNPNVADSYLDPDNDDFSNLEEFLMGTNPRESRKWAVLVEGGGLWYRERRTLLQDPMQGAFENGIRDCYSMLLDRGWTKDSICVIAQEAHDLDGDTVSDVSFMSTHDNVYDCIATSNGWLQTRSDGDDTVFMYFIDHGQELTGHFAIRHTQLVPRPVAEYITDEELGAWVEAVSCGKMIFVIEACFSGNIHDDMDESGRIVISSADADHPAWGVNPDSSSEPSGDEYAYFSNDLLQYLGTYSVEWAFYHSEWYIEYELGLDQNPVMSDGCSSDTWL